MKTLLAIDTSTQACSVALDFNGYVYQQLVNTPREHTRLVLPMVDKVLSDAGIALSAVDCLAFTCGPGSFTGLRIGFGIIQGLAFGVDIPVIPVSSLKTMAVRAVNAFECKDVTVMPVFDARMGELYWAVYRFVSGQIETLVADSVGTTADIIDQALVLKIDVGVGNGWPLLDLTQLLPAKIESNFTPDAASIIALAKPQLNQGCVQSINDVELLYIRDEISWKKRQKIRS